MPREIKTVSVSFIDLLCNAFGAVILLSVLMISSMQQSASEASKHTYFLLDAVVWIDVQPELEKDLGKERVEQALLAPSPEESMRLQDAVRDNETTQFRLQRRVTQYDVQMAIFYVPLFDDARDVPPPDGTKGWKEQLLLHHDSPTIQELANIPGRPQVNGRCSPKGVGRLRACVDPLTDKKRFYLRIDILAAAMELPRGYYFFRIWLSDGSAVLGNNVPLYAWMDLNGSGVGGRLLLRTHEILPEPELYAAEDKLQAHEKSLARAKQKWRQMGQADTEAHELQNRRTLKQLQVPDRYTPTWPSTFPGVENPLEHPRCLFERQLGQGDAAPWPWLSVRHKRGQPFPPGSGFPIPYPDGVKKPADHSRLGRYESAGPDDYYLPGLCVTSRRP